MGIMICLGQGGLQSLSAFSFHSLCQHLQVYSWLNNQDCFLTSLLPSFFLGASAGDHTDPGDSGQEGRVDRGQGGADGEGGNGEGDLGYGNGER